MFQTKTFQVTVWLAALVVTIWVGREIAFIFHPLVVLISTIAYPVITAGILFFLTKPIVDALQEMKVPRIAAIWLVFLVFLGLGLGVILGLIPVLNQQIESLVESLPWIINELERQIIELQDTGVFSRLEDFEFFRRYRDMDFEAMLEGWVDTLLENSLYYLGSLVNFAIATFTIPFFWFFMLKDSPRPSESIIGYIPSEYQPRLRRVFQEISQTLSSYIKGVLTVSLFVGVFVYIGYQVIGLDYALLLSMVSFVTNVIPYFGPLIGSVPGIIVGLIDSPLTGLKVLIMILIVQQMESQLIAPLVYSRRLHIHPVTVIVVLLTAGNLAGILGIILGVPAYAAGRVVVNFLIELIRNPNSSSIEARLGLSGGEDE